MYDSDDLPTTDRPRSVGVPYRGCPYRGDGSCQDCRHEGQGTRPLRSQATGCQEIDSYVHLEPDVRVIFDILKGSRPFTFPEIGFVNPANDVPLPFRGYVGASALQLPAARGLQGWPVGPGR
ncbi:callose synthase 7-like [Iris pallida]|uniref:Callose synthase 7-like n=1 Tax=Iris pallida TaxID=29817 RepID=A0AAX6F733_IRIPA|nr:callose synthase 7-like [Iris pallida]